MVLSAGLVFSLCRVLPARSQDMMTIRPQKPIICYQSFEDNFDHIGVSDRFLKMRQGATGRVKTASIEVQYLNFPAEAKIAFQFAVEIWESELRSTIPIRIRADWRPLKAGVLGQALWGSAHANFGGEQYSNTFYPVALAEKIAGHEINPSNEPDIVATFNSSASWYFGTDGNTPSGKMDMVTIVLHEIAHGLGYTDTYDVQGTQGSVGLPSGGKNVPFIFDVFVENSAKKNLSRDFQSPSSALATELQGSSLFFASPLSIQALSGIRPELYAPTTFDNGSSISHLDEGTFSAPQDANRLMTPHIAFAESIHDPGTVLLASLADMGWVYTNIDHEPLKDTERKNGQPYLVKVRVHSDDGYKDGTVKLHYTNNGTNFTTSAMTPTGVTGEYEFPLPGTTVDLSYGYFISVTDISGREFTSPGKIQEVGKPEEQGVHFFHVGPDQDPPEIAHEPIPFTPETNDELALSAEVTDNLGVGEVVVEYKVSDGPLKTVVMQKKGTTDEFTVVLDVPGLTFEDEIRYRIIARDLSAAQNVAMSPSDDFYVVDITGMMEVQDAYSNDFNHLSNDFFGTSFSIITPAGFRNGAIHSNHPYENGTGPNDESNYTYQLQIPIRIDDAEPVIKFDEIVLVEPGEEGSEFGDVDFYDYTVVEGSADGGLTWKPFGPGYDSRANSVWLTRYNSNLSGDNSQANGDSTLFRQRVIDMLENGDFSNGDVVLIRFRLFADQFAHGWGWAIDNLSIQTPVTGIERPADRDLRVYPVPARTQLFIELSNIATGPVSIYITDALGRTVYAEMTDETTATAFSKTIDLADFRNGLYVLRATAGKATYTRKFLKID